MAKRRVKHHRGWAKRPSLASSLPGWEQKRTYASEWSLPIATSLYDLATTLQISPALTRKICRRRGGKQSPSRAPTSERRPTLCEDASEGRPLLRPIGFRIRLSRALQRQGWGPRTLSHSPWAEASAPQRGQRRLTSRPFLLPLLQTRPRPGRGSRLWSGQIMGLGASRSERGSAVQLACRPRG